MSLTDLRMWGECRSSRTRRLLCPWTRGGEGRKKTRGLKTSEFVRIRNQPSCNKCGSFGGERQQLKKCITYWDVLFVACLYFDILPGLKCHSWSSEDDASATRTVSTVTGNDRRVGKAMTAATQLVTCPDTHWWPKAYLSQKKRYLDPYPDLDFRLVKTEPTTINTQMIYIAVAWGNINNWTLSIKTS